MEDKYIYSLRIKKQKKFGRNFSKLIKPFVIMVCLISLSLAIGFGIRWLLFESTCFAINQPTIIINNNSSKIISKEKVIQEYLKHCIKNYNSQTPSIFKINIKKLTKDLNYNFKRLADINCKKRILCNKLIIEIKERQPIAFVLKADRLLGLDAEGNIFETILDYDLPIITGITSQEDYEKIYLALLILSFLKKEEKFISEIALQDLQAIAIVLSNGCLVRLGSVENLQSKIFKLKTLLSNIENFNSIKLIDLRFKDIIIKGKDSYAQG
jgi:cell division septal protein FtsQ